MHHISLQPGDPDAHPNRPAIRVSLGATRLYFKDECALVALDCGSCGRALAELAHPSQLGGVFLFCPDCGRYGMLEQP